MHVLFALFLLFASSLTWSQVKPGASAQAAALTIERFDGGPVHVPLGFGIVLNKDSTLKREWFVVRDAQAPLSILGEAGVGVLYKQGERGIGSYYQYSTTYRVAPKEPIAAFEIRAVVIDAFGRPVRTLGATQLVTLSEPRDFDAQWRVWAESEASQAFASVIYVSQVRTLAGQVYVANRAAIFEQIRKVATRLSEADLEPKAEGPAR